jgi:hypothetical protein
MLFRCFVQQLHGMMRHSRERVGEKEQLPTTTDSHGWTVLVQAKLPSNAGMLINGLLVLVSLSALVAWGAVAVAHVDDQYLTNHVSGARMALARYVNHGVLYPPLYDGKVYGGTRFMPLPILLHATTARFTGEYLMSGKLLSYLMLGALLIVVSILLRRMRCPLPLALILTASLLITDPGFDAGFLMLGDALPTLLQLTAIAAVGGNPGNRRVVAAAALCALAFGSKLTAVWGLISIVIWLLAFNRRRLALFCTSYIVLVVGLMAAFYLMSEGRIVDNVFGLSLAGVAGPGAALDSPTRLLRILFLDTPALWVFLPMAVLAAAASVAERDVSIYEIAFMCQLPILLVVFADTGVGNNQFLDLAVLSILVIGRQVAHVSRLAIRAVTQTATSSVLRVMPGILGLMLVWITGTALVVRIPDARAAFASLKGHGTTKERALNGLATPDMEILSEDPYVPVALDQTPVVLDPFMFPRVAQREPDAATDLINRIEGHKFDLIVLLFPLEDKEWWASFHFGSRVISAVQREYEFWGRADGYYVYQPSPSKG